MNGDEEKWSDEGEPSDDKRVLRGRPATGQDGHSRIDYAEAIATQDAAWWDALSDYEYAYGALRALESACRRGAPLHLVRCVHHLHDLLSGLEPVDRAWAITVLRRIQTLLARRATGDGAAVTLAMLLAYLSDVQADPRFAPPPVLPVGLLQRTYPQGVHLEDLQDALDRHRYPRGKPLPACEVCEQDHVDRSDPLARAVAALPPAQRAALVHLGRALALDGDAPDVAGQLAWVTGAMPVPIPYEAVLAEARAWTGDGDVTVERALIAAGGTDSRPLDDRL